AHTHHAALYSGGLRLSVGAANSALPLTSSPLTLTVNDRYKDTDHKPHRCHQSAFQKERLNPVTDTTQCCCEPDGTLANRTQCRHGPARSQQPGLSSRRALAVLRPTGPDPHRTPQCAQDASPGLRPDGPERAA